MPSRRAYDDGRSLPEQMLTFTVTRWDALPVKKHRLPVRLMATVWLATYVVCIGLVCSFILFEVLDIDGSDFPTPPSTLATPIKLAEPAHEIKRSLLSAERNCGPWWRWSSCSSRARGSSVWRPAGACRRPADSTAGGGCVCRFPAPRFPTPPPPDPPLPCPLISLNRGGRIWSGCLPSPVVWRSWAPRVRPRRRRRRLLRS